LWKAAIWGALAYFWPIVNDAPVNADMLLGRNGYYFMEAVLNLLSLLCFAMAAREAVDRGAGRGTTWRVAALAVAAFLMSSADDSLGLIHPGLLKAGLRYPFEAATIGASLVFFCLMLRDGGRNEPTKASQP
jgi:hypothetical protein